MRGVEVCAGEVKEFGSADILFKRVALRGGAAVKPDDGGTEYFIMLANADQAIDLAPQGKRHDFSRLHTGSLHYLPHSGCERIFPRCRVLAGANGHGRRAIAVWL